VKNLHRQFVLAFFAG
jgi:putative transposase